MKELIPDKTATPTRPSSWAQFCFWGNLCWNSCPPVEFSVILLLRKIFEEFTACRIIYSLPITHIEMLWLLDTLCFMWKKSLPRVDWNSVLKGFVSIVLSSHIDPSVVITVSLGNAIITWQTTHNMKYNIPWNFILSLSTSQSILGIKSAWHVSKH